MFSYRNWMFLDIINLKLIILVIILLEKNVWIDFYVINKHQQDVWESKEWRQNEKSKDIPVWKYQIKWKELCREAKRKRKILKKSKIGCCCYPNIVTRDRILLLPWKSLHWKYKFRFLISLSNFICIEFQQSPKCIFFFI